jgi:aldose 1-epimerase
MSFTITARDVQAGGKAGTAYTLDGTHAGGAVRAEVWPSHGFNCLRWQTQTNGAWDDVLYCAPDWDTNPVPTRSGHPILFPFPNRLSAGQFTHQGVTYHLPLNESTGRHAIHGFTPRTAWRVIESGTAADHAFITGEFQISRDAPHAVVAWPADARIRITYRLFADRLRVEAAIDAADGKALPFGLGYHPYFRAPGGAANVADWQLVSHAHSIWEARENMPTGRQLPLSQGDPLDFRTANAVGATVLDTLYGDVRPEPRDAQGLAVVAKLAAPGAPRRLAVAIDAAYREVLLFTPQHRHAVAIEPYTCITDAANLAGTVSAGWHVVPTGAVRQNVVEYRLEPNV